MVLEIEKLGCVSLIILVDDTGVWLVSCQEAS